MALANLKEALETEDAAKINARSQDLTESAMKLGEAIYKAQAEQPEAPEGMGDDDAGEPRGVDEDIVDADFEDLGKDDR